MSFVQHSPAAERDRRRKRTARIVGLVVLVVVLAAAALLWPKPDRGALSVSSVSKVAPTGVLRGDLVASRTRDRVCYSIASGGTTAVLRFVPDWTADTMLGLRDPSGYVVGQPGDTMVLLGAPASVGHVAGCAQRGRIWTITGVKQRIVG